MVNRKNNFLRSVLLVVSFSSLPAGDGSLLKRFTDFMDKKIEISLKSVVIGILGTSFCFGLAYNKICKQKKKITEQTSDLIAKCGENVIITETFLVYNANMVKIGNFQKEWLEKHSNNEFSTAFCNYLNSNNAILDSNQDPHNLIPSNNKIRNALIEANNRGD